MSSGNNNSSGNHVTTYTSGNVETKKTGSWNQHHEGHQHYEGHQNHDGHQHLDGH